MGAGERLITRAFLKQELQDIKEEMRDKAGKTVAAVVKLIDDFSNPSREVAAQARDLEKRFNSVAGVFSHAGEAFTAAGETLTKSVTAPLVAVGTAAIKFSSDSQDAFQQFAAATGTASNEMGKYKDMINDVYKDNFGESINDVAEAWRLLIRTCLTWTTQLFRDVRSMLTLYRIHLE